MKFGAIPVAKALGTTLAHSTAVGETRFGKGRVLNADDIESLRQAGHNHVTVASLDTDDVAENDAAQRIGVMLETKAIEAKTASTGRVNLHAKTAGLLCVNAKIVNAINSVHPSITVATLPDFTVCQAGAMVATVKIIPFAAPEKTVKRAGELAAKGAMVLRPFKPLKIGLIQTTLPLTKDNVLQKTVDVTRQRIADLGGSLDVAANCRHDNEALAQTLSAMLDLDMLIVFGASAVCDKNDVIPAAFRLVGGKITRVGMPVDPGNLFVLGHVGKTILIGAPGCARSPKENGFDWVLARLFAGLKVTSLDIIGMGVGGLLMEISTRPSPRALINRAVSTSND